MTPAEKLAAKLRKNPHVAPLAADRAAICHLVEARNQLGLTQADVAKAVGISVGYICYMENGLRLPTLLLAVKLARFYGKKVEELWELPPEVQK